MKREIFGVITEIVGTCAMAYALGLSGWRVGVFYIGLKVCLYGAEYREANK